MEVLQNNKDRITKISQFMRSLLETKTSSEKKQLYEDYKDTINDINAMDLFYLDMYQEETAYSIDTIKESAGRFVNVFHYPLTEKILYDSSLLFQHFVKENKAIEAHLNSLKAYFKKDLIIKSKSILLKGFEKCMEFEKKFIKKEHILFPRLEEKVPSKRPLEVLWTIHDDAREQLRTIIKALSKKNITEEELIFLIGQYYYTIFGLHQKEELILLPVASQLLSEKDKENMYLESLMYGYVFVEAEEVKKELKEEIAELPEGFYQSPTGILSFQQLTQLFTYLPVDITFVDAQDKVTYFNDRKERHFPRNPSIIGRLVKYCHPPKSVHVVENIVNAFKEKEKDTAEFWIRFKDTFLYIIYYAVRSESGEYLGTLEVSQDVTRIRSLEGEQRILDWT